MDRWDCMNERRMDGGEWVLYEDHAAALAAETARADREAAARQEAEREGNAIITSQQADLVTLRASHEKWRDDCIKAESAWGEVVTERDRLRAELATLNGASQ